MTMYSLQSYKDENDTDLVESFLSDYTDYYDKCSKQIWALYRYAVLNACNSDTGIERWVQRAKDIAYTLDERYSQLFTAYESLKTAGDVTSITLKDSSVVTTTSKTDDVRSDSGTSEQTSEDIPQNAASTDLDWLTSRDKGTTGNESKGSAQTDGTVTTERNSTNGLIPLELFQRMKDGLFNPYLEYAREYDRLFMPFYADECDDTECWIW